MGCLPTVFSPQYRRNCAAVIIATVTAVLLRAPNSASTDSSRRKIVLALCGGVQERGELAAGWCIEVLRRAGGTYPCQNKQIPSLWQEAQDGKTHLLVQRVHVLNGGDASIQDHLIVVVVLQKTAARGMFLFS